MTLKYVQEILELLFESHDQQTLQAQIQIFLLCDRKGQGDLIAVPKSQNELFQAS